MSKVKNLKGVFSFPEWVSIFPARRATNTITVVHDFNGHEVNGVHGLIRIKCNDNPLYLVNKLHDFTEIHDLNGNLPYDDFVGKTHTRLYVNPPYQIVIKKVEGFAVNLFWTLQSIMNFTGSLNFPAKGYLLQVTVT